MPQYILHPALMGAQMADEMSRQRMNLYGEKIAQAAKAKYDETAAQNAAERQALYEKDMISMGLNPRTGEKLQAKPDAVAYPSVLQNVLLQRFAQLGINPSVDPDKPGAVVGPNRAVGTQAVLMNYPELAGKNGLEFLPEYSQPATLARLNPQLNVRTPTIWSDFLGIYGPTGEPRFTGRPMGQAPPPSPGQIPAEGPGRR